MKKKQLSKLALMGLATGAMMTSTVTLSAHTVVETQGTYLAGGCGGGGKCSGNNRPNPSNNYTADTFGQSASQAVNPNMAPKPESMRQGQVQGQQFNQANPNSQRMMNGQNSGDGDVHGCSVPKPANGQRSSGSCANQGSSNGQGSCNAQANQQRNNLRNQGAQNSCSNQGNGPTHSCSGGQGNGQTANSRLRNNNTYNR